ncbi:TlpA family protein disulfide reductase [Hoyosella rhizosphaerae]|uniref:Membrane protein n=1 Tax=Hoyosella rhizosphaerae TaxID=1755582 RepID=A0A916UJW5_9ACTN|nr:TlpA disulfide reductase family protein [Hoyosella rhizosphaerae]MBN4925362.1 TlpA family protein disulfide reductase [Hoyosella rhizosphaerae]GGC75816.1 membrane protein [Hoyosella rhizosphaerae]
MSSSGKWTIAAFIVVFALVVAIWPRDAADDTTPTSPPGPQQPGAQQRETTGEITQSMRLDAQLDACPQPDPSARAWSVQNPISDVTLTCLGDGTPVSLGAALAGKPAVLNIWAYWCGPCAEELPALQEYAHMVGDDITVLTVHRDPKEANALAKLIQYDVRLPGIQDGSGRVPALLGAPAVLPVTIVLHADGAVASILAEPFTTAEEIDAAVTVALRGGE